MCTKRPARLVVIAAVISLIALVGCVPEQPESPSANNDSTPGADSNNTFVYPGGVYDLVGTLTSAADHTDYWRFLIGNQVSGNYKVTIALPPGGGAIDYPLIWGSVFHAPYGVLFWDRLDCYESEAWCTVTLTGAMAVNQPLYVAVRNADSLSNLAYFIRIEPE